MSILNSNGKKIMSFNAIHATQKIKACPHCNKIGKLVKAETVRHLVQSQFEVSITEDKYVLCMTESCEVAYYSLTSDMVVDKASLNVPLWYKVGANPKYVCYCSKVTEEQVRAAVMNEGAKSVQEVTKLTGAMEHCDCVHNNPLGKCCHLIIQEAIDKAMKGLA